MNGTAASSGRRRLATLISALLAVEACTFFLFAPLHLGIRLAGVSSGWSSGAFAGEARTAPGGGPDPMNVLRERFARGEIDQDEYERRRRVLEGQ